MKPNHNDLCAAIIAIGAEPCALDDLGQNVFDRLAELGLIQWSNGEWELTRAGLKLLPALINGDDVPSLE